MSGPTLFSQLDHGADLATVTVAAQTSEVKRKSNDGLLFFSATVNLINSTKGASARHLLKDETLS